MRSVQNEKGFTLIEVLVAVTIFAFGILAVVQMQLLAGNTNIKSRMMTEAIVVAQNEIERLMFLQYNHDDLVPGDGDMTKGWAFDNNPAVTVTNEVQLADFNNTTHPIYEIGWNVQPNVPYDNTKTVRVIVKWVDQNIKQRFSLYMVKTDEE